MVLPQHSCRRSLVVLSLRTVTSFAGASTLLRTESHHSCHVSVSGLRETVLRADQRVSEDSLDAQGLGIRMDGLYTSVSALGDMPVW